MNSRDASPSAPFSPPHTKVVVSPGLNSATPSRSLPMRSFGPGRSCRTATWRPARPAASRTSRAVSACSSALPWEKFSRATSIPASTMRASTSGSRDAGPMVATIFVRRSIYAGTVAIFRLRPSREGAVLQERLAVGAQPAAVAQVADQVPVHHRLVRAAGLGIGAPEREVDRPADLLVVEDRPDRAVDAEVRADADLPEIPRAGVRVQRRLQIVVAARRAGRHHAALAQLELDLLHRDAAGRGGQREADAPLGGRLVRAGEHLPAGHVALAVGVDPGAAGHAEREVRALGLDTQLALGREALDQPRLEL